MKRLEPGDDALRLAAEAVLRGDVVVYPTETLYGLGALATNEDAVRRLFEIKRRPPDSPVPVIASDLEMAGEIIEGVSPLAQKLIERFWPGPLTIVFDAKLSVPKTLTAGTGTVGVRVSSGDVAAKLVKLVGRPITATSANVSGTGDPSDPDAIAKELCGVALMIDAGKLKPGPGSTVVDARGAKAKIIREGAIPKDLVFSVAG